MAYSKGVGSDMVLRTSPLWTDALKITLLAVFCIVATSAFAQGKFSVQQGSINFASNAQLELIKASSDKIQALGYEFKFLNLKEALKNIYGPPKAN